MTQPQATRSSALAGVLALSVLVALGFLAARALPRTTSSGREPALVVPIEEHGPDAGEEPFVPDLPEVPDLVRDRPSRGADLARDPAADALAQEMRLVHEARVRLDEDPHAALDMLEQHRSRFPEGALAEEREAYAILAMILLDRPEGEVERRFLELTADHPGTSFAPTIREAIARRAEARDRR
ncbi:MAG: hypothetical protein OHK0013_48500 [Sandaracinaceae bacterium]